MKDEIKQNNISKINLTITHGIHKNIKYTMVPRISLIRFSTLEPC